MHRPQLCGTEGGALCSPCRGLRTGCCQACGAVHHSSTRAALAALYARWLRRCVEGVPLLLGWEQLWDGGWGGVVYWGSHALLLRCNWLWRMLYQAQPAFCP